ncbi:MAG: hypothetical protein HGA37_01795 [Lentimicrobium sp.]|nr:hypothetical protein [Lentimicrobium sp.]
MIKVIKNIAVILLLVSFLVPASGVLVFIHECSSVGSTELSIDGSNSCCDAHSSLFLEIVKDECAISHQGHCTHHTFLNNESCCKDSRLFVKIGLDYLASVSKIFNADVRFFELPDSFLVEPSGFNDIRAEVFIDSPHPPGIDTYLFTSSLRL